MSENASKVLQQKSGGQETLPRRLSDKFNDKRPIETGPILMLSALSSSLLPNKRLSATENQACGRDLGEWTRFGSSDSGTSCSDRAWLRCGARSSCFSRDCRPVVSSGLQAPCQKGRVKVLTAIYFPLLPRY
ncbi:hypothetical protein AURANDRAFT_67828 [Aureococcus anophagefferens]|uniref:Uncharacterized protein n=1 Tax=Aureococcus anophagefferens TaxID=44056 RepID=F0YMJ4_AURAN|nr:hypothetical protein AURANDRAFT_67828 [Aureococcus anophagefferens]EGB03634.1 hypothetical protein AURANDRAFT_67828 [Aureococcus anophagefferens]|eukprot:XP_009041636.1 hypothetical protein AURANDRAFT_67828 [Aureococcus anophagefferens]